MIHAQQPLECEECGKPIGQDNNIFCPECKRALISCSKCLHADSCNRYSDITSTCNEFDHIQLEYKSIGSN